MKLIFVSMLSFFLGGCFAGTGGFLEALEAGAYDRAATYVSGYCERSGSVLVGLERQNARRQIRALGSAGPVLPEVAGDGPMVRIWCRGETVPQEVWKDLK